MVCQAYRGALGRVGWSPPVATLTSGVTSGALRPGKCAELGSCLGLNLIRIDMQKSSKNIFKISLSD